MRLGLGTSISSGSIIDPWRHTSSLSFDSVDDYLYFGAALDVDFGTADFSISLWVKTDDLTTNYFVSKNGGSDDHWYIRGDSSDQIQFYSVESGTDVLNFNTAALTALENTWIHIVVTSDRSGASHKIYINGELSVTDTDSSTATLTNNGSLLLNAYSSSYGADAAGATNQIDEFAIWDVVLDADAVARLYEGELGPEMITTNYANNGTFTANNGDWAVYGTNSTIEIWSSSAGETGGGLATSASDASTDPQGVQLGTDYFNALEIGSTYRVTVDLKAQHPAIQDDYKISLGGVTSAAFDITTSFLTYTEDFTVTSDAPLIIYNEDTPTKPFYIDNVSIKKLNAPIDLRSDSGDYDNSGDLQGYWRMGDGDLDSFPIIADQTNPAWGPELWDSPASTNGSVANWDLYVGSSNGLAQVTEDGTQAVRITYVDNSAGASTDLGSSKDLNANLVVGKMYQFSCDAKVNSGSVGITVNTGNPTTTVTETTFTRKTVTFFATSIASDYIKMVGMGGSEIIYLDNFSLKVLNGTPGLMKNMTAGSIESVYPFQGLLAPQNNTKSLAFDGTDDCLVTQANGTSADATYSFWARASETGYNRGVFGHGAATRTGFHFNYLNHKPLLIIGTDYHRYWDDTSAQDDGNWHHWVVWVDISDPTNCKLYVDGVLQTASTTVTSGSAFAHDEPLTIGADEVSGGNHFEGHIDDFAYWDVELDIAAIKSLYNFGYPTDVLKNSGDYNSADDLQGYWRMGDGDLDTYPLIADQTNATLSANMVDADASVFTSGTYGWTEQGSNDISNDNGSLKVIYDDNQYGAAFYFKAAEDGFSSNLVVGTTYQVTFDAKVSSGATARWIVYNGSSYTHSDDITNTSFESHTIYITAGSVDDCRIINYGLSSGESIWLDNLSVKAVNGNPGMMTNMTSADIEEETP